VDLLQLVHLRRRAAASALSIHYKQQFPIEAVIDES
jgi:hypothetical protein